MPDSESMAAELQRTHPAELLYPETFGVNGIIERQQGLRRRPIWEFENVKPPNNNLIYSLEPVI